MDITKCGTCRGTKEVNSLGGMRKKCPSCNGVGFVKAVVENEGIIVAEIMQEIDKPFTSKPSLVNEPAKDEQEAEKNARKFIDSRLKKEVKNGNSSKSS